VTRSENLAHITFGKLAYNARFSRSPSTQAFHCSLHSLFDFAQQVLIHGFLLSLLERPMKIEMILAPPPPPTLKSRVAPAPANAMEGVQATAGRFVVPLVLRRKGKLKSYKGKVLDLRRQGSLVLRRRLPRSLTPRWRYSVLRRCTTSRFDTCYRITPKPLLLPPLEQGVTRGLGLSPIVDSRLTLAC
jgi:hypothetical protein